MDNFNQIQERELGWDDEITAEAMEFTILPPATYDFVIKKPVERGRKPASEKMPACNKATVTLSILYNGQEVEVLTTLLLYSKMEWKLSQFFESIGLKKKGQPLKMKWNEIVGCRGKVKISHREYNGRTYNNADEFVLPKTPESMNNWSANQGW